MRSNVLFYTHRYNCYIIIITNGHLDPLKITWSFPGLRCYPREGTLKEEPLIIYHQYMKCSPPLQRHLQFLPQPITGCKAVLPWRTQHPTTGWSQHEAFFVCSYLFSIQERYLWPFDQGLVICSSRLSSTKVWWLYHNCINACLSISAKHPPLIWEYWI